MASAALYLNFPGTTEEAFEFYRSVFGGEFSPIQRFGQTPGVPALPENDRNKIMHMSLQLTKGMVLHGTDALKSMGQNLTQGNNFYIMLEVESREEAEKYYNALSVGGKDEMPLQDTFWGAYFGSFTDKFGVQWMIDFEQTP
jgi:PhnB protein